MVRHVPEFQRRICPVCHIPINGKISPLANINHTRSITHRRSARLKELLQSDATLQTIADELGITRERVRQLANKMDISRRDAQLRRTEQRRANQQHANFERFLTELPNTRLGRFLEACAQRGLTSELVMYGSTTQWRPNRAIVNGKRVLVKPAYDYYNAFGTHYIRVVSTNNEVDVVAYELPDGRWAFFKPFGRYCNPDGTRGSNSTLFALHDVQPGDKGYTLNKDHNHRDNIENWALLTD